MNNPIRLFNSLSETFIRYLDSPFDLRYPELVAERDAILNTDGCLHREPLIEPVLPYEDCGQTFPQMAQALLGGTWSAQEVTDLSNFVTLQLFPTAGQQPRRPYTHQRDVFREAVVNGHDVVVTTGTGSGKTECFLLPILAQLVRESANSRWGQGVAAPHNYDWWNHGPQRVPQRGPTRAKRQWRELAVDAMGVANEAPDDKFPESSFPKLTLKMVAKIQSFPDDWEFPSSKTLAYRQIGNAFPPQFARAIGLAIMRALNHQRAPAPPNGNGQAADLPLFTIQKPSKRLCRTTSDPNN